MKRRYEYDSPIGQLTIAEADGFITDFSYGGRVTGELKETALIKEAYDQFLAYLAGQCQSFQLPLKPEGTPFQKQVWTALLEIPYGETRSYKDIAQSIGNPLAVRAVGMANNKNPLAVLVPCHRVIGSNGKLVGYAGGLEVKEFLLKLEQGNM